MLRTPSWLARLRRSVRPIVTHPRRDKLSLLVEQLECREVPANVLTGHVFEDFNFNGVRDITATINNLGATTATSATTATIANGGSGYAVGDVLIVIGGTATTGAETKLRVTSVGAGGVITAVNFVHRGNYTTAPTSPVSTTFFAGGGTGATFNIAFAVDTTPLAVDAGVGGITVTVTGNNGFASTVTTAADGSFTINDAGGVAGTQYRVQFTNLPAGFTDAPHGASSLSSVQFVTGTNGTSTVDYGIARAADYFPNTPNGPTLITEYYHAGGGLTGGNKNLAAIVTIPYAAGTQSNDPDYAHYAPNNTTLATVGQVGATYGLAYNAHPANPVVYAAAYQKTYAGYAYNAGAGGTGAIYSVRADGSGVSIFADLNVIVGAGTAGADTHASNPLNDNAAGQWNAAGKVSLGGMALSADGTRLYVMNLADRTLYALRVNADGTYGGSYYTVAIPNWGSVPGAAGAAGTGATSQGDLRPFAVTYFNGGIYIGMVNSAETTQNRADMKAYVYRVTDSSTTLAFASTPTIQFDLNYLRGNVNGGASAAWQPWLTADPGDGVINYPQPTLSGITFDAAGNMTLGIRDRTGDQRGVNGVTGVVFGITGGDTLRAGLNPTTGQYTLENLGQVTVSTNPYGSTFTNTTTVTGSTANAAFNGPGSLPVRNISGTNGATKSGTTVTITTTAAHGFTAGQTVQITNVPGGDYNGTYTITSVTTNSFTYEQATNAPLGNSGGGQARVSGKFYYQDTYGGTQSLGNPHGAISTGGVLQLPGFENVVVSTFDSAYGTSFSTAFNTGGLSWFNANDGTNTKDIQVYLSNSSQNFGKANGVGAVIAAQPLAPVAIGNRVWHDLNGDGIQGAGELGIPGVTVRLFAPGADPATATPLATAITDANGNYSFSSDTTRTSTGSDRFGVTGLTHNTNGYVVTFDATTETDPTISGLVLTAANRGGDDELDSDATVIGGIAQTTVNTGAPGSVNHTIDAGYYQPVSVGDFVWHDLNGNGVQNGGEPGINGVVVNLTGTTGAGVAVNLTATTAGNGGYLFSNLAPGTYTVTVDAANFSTGNALAGYLATATGQGGNGALDSNASPAGTTPGALPSGASDLTLDFGYYRPVSVGNFVWHDQNGNGLQDGSEPGIVGVTLNLSGTDGLGNPVTRTTTTVAGGAYLFDNLLPGTYTVSVDAASAALAGFVATASNVGGNDAIDSDNPAGATTTPAALPSGTSDLTLDFGYYRPVSVGNFVWHDLNANGLQDSGEPGINGVTLTLTGTSAAGVAVTRTTTTADLGAGNGGYLFDNLPPGTYTVTVDATNFNTGNALAGYTATASNVGGNDAIDSDNPAGATTTPGTLASGGSDLTLDFGYYRRVSVGDFVWEDLDGDGVQDGGEPGINGVVVHLTGTDGLGNPVNLTATTAGNGGYLFDNLLPGTYTVTVDPTNFNTGNALAGYLATATGRGGDPALDSNPSPTAATVVPSGTNNLTLDFGYYRPVSVGDFVWHDLDGDGVQDSGEPGINGVTLTLSGTDGLGNPVTRTTTTAGNGAYLFSNLLPGTYTVTVDPANFNTGNALAGYLATATGQGGNPALDSNPSPTAATVVPSGTNNLTLDFGYYQPVSVGNFVWQDTNGNGLQDSGEPGIVGVILNLTGTSAAGVPVTRTTTTVAGGAYLFDNLPPGTYTVSVDATSAALAGFVATASNVGGNDAIDSDNPAGATTTPGTLASGGSDLTLDFGYYRPVSVGNFVWHDQNANGLQDSGEPGINGVTLTLTGTDGLGNPVLLTTTTAGNGGYLFDNLLPGTYTVSVDATSAALAGFVATASNVGGNDAIDSDNPAGATTTPGTLASGGSDLTLDFGYYRPVSVGNFVWHDQNGNGIQDGSEPGIVGVTLNLSGTDGLGNPVTRTTTTVAGGAYLFDNLPPGTYTVSVDAANFNTGNALAGYTATASNVGGNDAIDSDNPAGANTTPSTLASGGSDLTLDFGYYRPVSVGNFVWNDQNGNGIQDGSEPGIVGVTLNLSGTDGLGNPVTRTTTTVAGGAYLFDNLLPGTYTVTVDPANFNTGSALATFIPTATGAAGSTTANDSNANPSGTTPGTLASGASDLTLDFGYVQGVSIGNFVWRDTNGNGIQDGTEPGIQGVVIRLTGTDAAGNPVDVTTMTGSAGEYLFTQRPGTYTVSVDASNFTGAGVLVGFTATAQDRGGNDAVDSDNPAGTATTPATLAAGGSDRTIDFGYYQPVLVGNFVWHDQNGNGIQDGTEPGINGVVVNLTGTDGAGNLVSLTTTTAGNGGYLFSNLAPGTYTVTVDSSNFNTGNALAGYVASAAGQGGNGALDSNASPSGTTPGALPSGASDLTLDFGYHQPVSIGNFVWSDTNRDGIQDGGEPGIGGVALTLTGTDGLGNPVNLTTTTVAGTGAYLFSNLLPGTYTVTVAPSNFATGGALRGYLASPTGAAGSTAANDSNATPSGTTPGTLTSGADDPDVDFGYYPTADLSLTKTVNRPTAPVGTQVVFTVTVRNDGPLAATGVTVLDQLPTGFTYVSDTGAGAYNPTTGVWTVGGLAIGATQTLQITATVVASGNYTNFAEIATSDQPDVDSTPNNGPQGPPAEDDEAAVTVAPPSSIAGVVYVDSNRDGDRDPGEPGIAGVRVTLFNATTGAQGRHHDDRGQRVVPVLEPAARNVPGRRDPAPDLRRRLGDPR